MCAVNRIMFASILFPPLWPSSLVGKIKIEQIQINFWLGRISITKLCLGKFKTWAYFEDASEEGWKKNMGQKLPCFQDTQCHQEIQWYWGLSLTYLLYYEDTVKKQKSDPLLTPVINTLTKLSYTVQLIYLMPIKTDVSACLACNSFVRVNMKCLLKVCLKKLRRFTLVITKQIYFSECLVFIIQSTWKLDCIFSSSCLLVVVYRKLLHVHLRPCYTKLRSYSMFTAL